MAVCKHCGTEIEDGLEYCPNCGQNIDDIYSGDFFEPDEALEEEMYNIFDSPEEFDMDSLLSREFNHQPEVSHSRAESAFVPEELSFFEETSFVDESETDVFTDEVAGEEEFFEKNEPDDLFRTTNVIDNFISSEPQPVASEEDDLAELLGLFGEEQAQGTQMSEEPSVPEEFSMAAEEDSIMPVAEETDFFALDDLFQELDTETMELFSDTTDSVDHGLEELLAASAPVDEDIPDKKKNGKKKKEKEKKSFFQAVFGNVPVDPSKIKPEPTPEEIAAKKAKEAQEKQAKAEEKKLAAEEKKQLAQREKDEKARQKALAKEEKKAKKLQEAKKILEEMQETRINRVGATIVFIFFTVCAIVLLSGSEIFGYAISIHSAEKNFNQAYNNDTRYYTDAYEDIYGLEIKPEDQVLNDKIMTVMFVNKHLNSYNSYKSMNNYQAALHSLLLGLHRYGVYYETAIPLGIERDMDYVRTQILGELEKVFKISEDEAELLRSMLADAGAGGIREDSMINADAARVYNLKLYEIVKESGLDNDSNN